MSTVDVIVPVFNEEEVLPSFYQRLMALPLAVHPIFIDNASTDDSLKIIKSFSPATVIEHTSNEGYGASLRDGIKAAKADRIVIIDADCEYPPEAIPEMISMLDGCDIVYASRFLEKQQTKMPWLKVQGNRSITLLFNWLFDQSLTDLYTGSRAFRREVVADLLMEQNGFEHVLEVAARLARSGYSFREFHVTFSPRQTGASKMAHISEALKCLYYLYYYHMKLDKGLR